MRLVCNPTGFKHSGFMSPPNATHSIALFDPKGAALLALFSQLLSSAWAHEKRLGLLLCCLRRSTRRSLLPALHGTVQLYTS
eukprot:m.377895 g.377895  ORF g.377895 m.377895 type:complete len:82 (+) comp20023_c1_seq17:179-424(+)